MPLLVANGVTGSKYIPRAQWEARNEAADGMADFVLLDANPLADIRDTRRINAVVANGGLLDGKALDALLAQAGAAARR